MIRYGTSELSAPELYPHLRRQIEPKKFNGYEQDVWALGFLLYSMLNGNLPSDIGDYIQGKAFTGAHYPIDESLVLDTQCNDLLKRMLCVDIGTRITANEILAHSWLRTRTRR